MCMAHVAMPCLHEPLSQGRGWIPPGCWWAHTGSPRSTHLPMGTGPFSTSSSSSSSCCPNMLSSLGMAPGRRGVPGGSCSSCGVSPVVWRLPTQPLSWPRRWCPPSRRAQSWRGAGTPARRLRPQHLWAAGHFPGIGTSTNTSTDTGTDAGTDTGTAPCAWAAAPRTAPRCRASLRESTRGCCCGARSPINAIY